MKPFWSMRSERVTKIHNEGLTDIGDSASNINITLIVNSVKVSY